MKHAKHHFHYTIAWVVAAMVGLTVTTTIGSAHAQGSIAIVPLFHDRKHQAEGDMVIQLARQRVIIFVYRNASAVYLDADFINTKSDSITHELALPSVGHASIRSNARSNGILGVQLWVGGERVEPAIDRGNGTWYTIAPAFGPHEEKRVRALFWVQTSLAMIDDIPSQDSIVIPEGKRAFLVDLEHSTAWMDVIQSMDVSVTLRESLTERNSRMGIEPKNYLDQHGGFYWSLHDIEPSFSDDISVIYTPPASMASHWNTMAKLSAYIEHTAYDELLTFVRQLDEE